MYGPADRNMLDVYIPPGETKDKPVLMYVHGGGFVSGDKRWSEKVRSLSMSLRVTY